MTAVITGASGVLGGHLLSHMGGPGGAGVIGTSFSQRRPGLEVVDFTDGVQVDRFLDRHRPDQIIHTIALADVDRSQQLPAEAYRLTVLTTAHVASWIRRASPETRLTYISTDQVYDGTGPHGEDAVQPGNVYALTKLWAESTAREVPAHLVLRLNYFGPSQGGRQTLSDWLLRGLRERRPLELFHDVYFSPLYVEHVAAAIQECAEKGVRGTFNLGASGEGLSKADFAALVAEIFDLTLAYTTRVSVLESRLAAYRPSDMRLRVDRLQEQLGHRLPTIREGVELMRARMEGQNG